MASALSSILTADNWRLILGQGYENARGKATDKDELDASVATLPVMELEGCPVPTPEPQELRGSPSVRISVAIENGRLDLSDCDWV